MINKNIKLIQKYKVFAVIRAENTKQALDLSYALLEGGINIIEISLLTPKPYNVISKLKKDDVFIGAGTVMDSNMAIQAIDAGSQFIISPFTDRDIIKTAIKQNIIVASGCLTPTEIIYANKLGANFIKIFPAHSLGGVSYLKSLIDIFPHIPFMPTGGVNLTNLNDYFSVGVMAVGMSSALLDKDTLANYDSIKNRAKQCTSIINQLSKNN